MGKHTARIENHPDGTRTSAATMSESLAQRRQETLLRCTDEATRQRRRLLFGMTTSLELQCVPLPKRCDMDMSILHTVASSSDKRPRPRTSTAQAHVWRYIDEDSPVRVTNNVYAMDLFHTWAQLAAYTTIEDHVMIGDAIITAKARRRNADPHDIHQSFNALISSLPRFKGKTRALRSIRLVRPNALSPKESEGRLFLGSYGLPWPATNHVVEGVTFRSGAPMTLDMAWPEYKVAVEYDGDQHRTDQAQWRRDMEKRQRLQSLGWVIMIMTAGTFDSEDSKAEFSFRLARQLLARGAVFTFRPTARPLEKIASGAGS